ncbi:MAG: hypothetical protein QE271_11535 [Bacteriovoracaceae bacterium]|nr:hypothetical protein [Bacteriovoracaceae bacterium]
MDHFQLSPILLMLFTALLAFSCGGQKNLESLNLRPAEVAPEESLIDLTVKYCPVPDQLVDNILLLNIILDRSNSVWQQLGANNLFCYEGTNPDNSIFDSIKLFVKGKFTDPTLKIYFAITAFGVSSGPECSNYFANGTQAFSNNQEEILGVLDNMAADLGPLNGVNFLNDKCTGATNYIDALNQAANVKNQFTNFIKQLYPYNPAPSAPKARSNILNIMMTDGLPFVNGFQQNRLDILKSVLALKEVSASLTNSNIIAETNSVNMILFTSADNNGDGTPDLVPLPDADPSCSPLIRDNPETLLKDMARFGGGFYKKVENAPTLDDLVIPPFLVEYKSNELILVNENASWYQDDQGQIIYGADDDGDGLSNYVESNIGSNKNSVDTDNNGYSDLVEFRYFGRTTQNNIPACSSPINDDTDGDGLTNCQELLIGSNPNLSDTNRDGIPDGLSLRFNIPLNLNNLTDRDFDGVPDNEEILLGLPPDFPNYLISSQLNPMTYNYSSINGTLSGQKGCSEANVTFFRIYEGQINLKLKMYYYAKQTTSGSQQFIKKSLFLTLPKKYCLYQSNLNSEVCNISGLTALPFENEVFYETP